MDPKSKLKLKIETRKLGTRNSEFWPKIGMLAKNIFFKIPYTYFPVFFPSDLFLSRIVSFACLYFCGQGWAAGSLAQPEPEIRKIRAVPVEKLLLFSDSGFPGFQHQNFQREKLGGSDQKNIYDIYYASLTAPGIFRAVLVEILRFLPVPIFPGSTGKYAGGYSGFLQFRLNRVPIPVGYNLY